jgi:hypothetical protein
MVLKDFIVFLALCTLIGFRQAERRQAKVKAFVLCEDFGRAEEGEKPVFRSDLNHTHVRAGGNDDRSPCFCRRHDKRGGVAMGAVNAHGTAGFSMLLSVVRRVFYIRGAIVV